MARRAGSAYTVSVTDPDGQPSLVATIEAVETSCTWILEGIGDLLGVLVWDISYFGDCLRDLRNGDMLGPGRMGEH